VNDEGFREIQLNGKQLIFLFMAVTVVLVVTFLFGVLVGRGVREGGAPQIASGDIASDPGLVPASEPAGPPSAAGGAAAPAPPAEELSYADRLLRDSAPQETLKPAAQPAPAPVIHEPVSRKAPVPPPPAAAPKESVPAPPPAAAPTAAAPSDRTPTTVTSGSQNAPVTPAPAPVTAAKVSDPSGPGFAVQVAAYRDRRDADTLAKQLAAKGYPAFVMDPVKGTSTALFRVRVGKYKTLKDAEAVESRLQTSEQLTNAWIAR
jgi:cell division septation protein DedD